VVPLHLDPVARSNVFKEWVSSWFELAGTPMRFAQPLDWPYNAHQPGAGWVWCLPPAAALYALEELAMVRVKCKEHVRAIVCVPLLLGTEWMRRFVRSVDVYFKVPAGCSFWPASMHEPLLIGLSLPFLRCEPWCWREANFMVGLGRTLSGLFKKDEHAGRDLLHKFWQATETARDMPPKLVRKLLSASYVHPFLGVASDRRKWGCSSRRPGFGRPI
jgi:hypothetical protein